jgi:polyisoprenyl-phosphate glycosyltransferase
MNLHDLKSIAPVRPDVPKVTIVVPVYNEATNINPFFNAVQSALADVPCDWKICYVNDGSRDDSLVQLCNLADREPRVSFISLSRNFGHQSALKAGLDHADGDCVVSMDGDLQHPPQLLPGLLLEWQRGADVVYTIRADNETAGWLKRLTSRWYYRAFRWLAEIKLEAGAADFRLLDRKVADVIKSLPENDLFLRGLIPWVGFKQVAVPYTPQQRHSGKSQYTFSKMFRLALDGILAFSVKPLRLASLLGLFVSGFAATYAIYALIVFLIVQTAVSGWTSLLLSVLFLGGVQLLTIGLMGEYLGRLLKEVKRRPNYIIQHHRE